MKTYQPKEGEVVRMWHLIDAKGEILGRMATKIATLLMGKQKPEYSAHMDSGDWVVVTNSKEIVLTGNKMKDKKYYSHSMYPGGFKEVTLERLMAKNPNKIIEKAVHGMLPGNKLKKQRMGRLKVYVDDKHPYGEKFNK